MLRVLPRLPTTTPSSNWYHQIQTLTRTMTHYVWRPHHHGATPSDYKTYYVASDDEKLANYKGTPTSTQKSLLVTGCNYGCFTEFLTIRFYKYHMIDVAAVNGPGYAYVSSLRHLLISDKSQGGAMNYIKEIHPNNSYFMDEFNVTTNDVKVTTSGKRRSAKSQPPRPTTG